MSVDTVTDAGAGDTSGRVEQGRRCLSYGWFSRRETVPNKKLLEEGSCVVARVKEREGRTEIVVNVPGLLDWSDMGVRVGDTLPESFCIGLMYTILVELSEWA